MKRGVVALSATLLLLSGCRATVDVSTTVGRDGAGTVRATVTLDKAAAIDVGDLQLRTADLVKAGWKVTPPTPTADGGQVVVVSRGFAGPADFHRALAELGPPFGALTLTRHRSFFRTHTAAAGTVDLRGGVDAFGDARLTGQVGGPGLGLSAADQAALAQAVHFNLDVKVPGAHRSWQPRLGAATAVRLAASSWNLDVLGPTLLALVTALALTFVLLWRRVN